MKREYLILDDSMTPEEWRVYINDCLQPHYSWLNQWKFATVAVHYQSIARDNLIVLERFIVGLGVGVALEKNMVVKFTDCRNVSPVMKAVFEMFTTHYKSSLIEPALKTRKKGKLTDQGVKA